MPCGSARCPAPRAGHHRQRLPLRPRLQAIAVPHPTRPLLTRRTAEALLRAHTAGAAHWQCSLDLGRSEQPVALSAEGFTWGAAQYPWPAGRLKDRTLYWWDGEDYAAVSRYSGALIKLVPTEWGPPTFEIDGIKMLPTAKTSPLDDARRKVALVRPQGATVLDTCGGLGYFAACCLEGGVARMLSFEKNPDVLWLRTLNPWSPDPDAPEHAGRLELREGDVSQAIAALPDAAFDAVLHDPPRFGIAGELYAQAFYEQLARVMRRGGRLFHYTGNPNALTSGRNVPREVVARLKTAGFNAEPALDGVFAVRR